MTKLIINTDGGARGNPGPSAIGVVITSHDEKITKDAAMVGSETKTFGEYIGVATNNVAEYKAVIKGLEEAKKLSGAELDFFLDSELVVKQLKGEYRVKDANLAKLWVEAKRLCGLFKKVSFTHVPRAKNKEADAIVNEVLDSLEIKTNA